MPTLTAQLVANIEQLRAFRSAAYGEIPVSELDLPSPALRVLETQEGMELLASWALVYGEALRKTDASLAALVGGHPSRRSVERLLKATDGTIGTLELALSTAIC